MPGRTGRQKLSKRSANLANCGGYGAPRIPWTVIWNKEHDSILLGQTFRQWGSFMRTSNVREALASTSGLYSGNGTDKQNPISEFDALRAELAAQGYPAVLEQAKDSTHGFELQGQPAERLSTVSRRNMDWFGLKNVTAVPR